MAPIQKLLQSSKVSSADRVTASNFFDYLRDTQTRINADAAAAIVLALACGVTKLAYHPDECRARPRPSRERYEFAS